MNKRAAHQAHVRAVAEYLSRVQGTAPRLEQGRYWIRCIAPDHPDTTPSLDLKLGDKGMVVGYCHGCQAQLDDLPEGGRHLLRRKAFGDYSAAPHDEDRKVPQISPRPFRPRA